MFGYGIDDVTANLEFLSKVKGAIEEIMSVEKLEKAVDAIIENNDVLMKKKIAEQVKKIWNETEEGFVIKNRKYQ